MNPVQSLARQIFFQIYYLFVCSNKSLFNQHFICGIPSPHFSTGFPQTISDSRYQLSRAARVLILCPTHQRRKFIDTCSEKFRARFVAMEIIKVQAGACVPEMRDMGGKRGFHGATFRRDNNCARIVSSDDHAASHDALIGNEIRA